MGRKSRLKRERRELKYDSDSDCIFVENIGMELLREFAEKLIAIISRR